MSWDDYRLFLAVVRAGSIRAAARDLHTDHSTISRRLGRLEEALGTKLVHRRSRGLLPTPAGEELLAAAEQMESQAQRAERRLTRSDDELAGWVRISGNVTLGLHLMMPLLPRFAAAHPGIELDIELTQDLADLTNNHADVALRVGLAPPEDSIARRVSGFALAIYASTDEPTHWIGWDPDGPYAVFIKETDCVDLPVRYCIRDDLMVCEAAKRGLGAAILPCFLGDAEPGLRRLGEATIVASVFILRHPDHRSTARIRTFVDFISEALGEVTDLLEAAGHSEQARSHDTVRRGTPRRGLERSSEYRAGGLSIHPASAKSEL